MKSDRINKITRNQTSQAILGEVESKNNDFSNFKINEIIAAYGDVTAYFFKVGRWKNGSEEKKIVGPWITTLYRARAKKWAERGLKHINEQIIKAKCRKNDPNYMQMFDDIYYDALIKERDILKEKSEGDRSGL